MYNELNPQNSLLVTNNFVTQSTYAWRNSISTVMQTISYILSEIELVFDDDHKCNLFKTNPLLKVIEMEKPLVIDIVETSLLSIEAAEREIFSSLNWDNLQIGGAPMEAESMLKNLIYKTPLKRAMLDRLSKICIKNNTDPLLLCTILHILSHMEYEMIRPVAPTIAMALLLHNDNRVVSFAIKAFSNWNFKESLTYIQDIRLRENWFQQDLDSVISYIKDNGDEIDGIPDEKI